MKKKLLLVSLIILFGFATSICTAKYSGGNGSETNPYRISNAYDMNDIGLHDEDWDKHFVLTNDIDLAQFNIIIRWPFTGIFDGNGFAISNFTYESSSFRNSIGLFRFVDDPNAEIKNLTLIDPNISAERAEAVGSLVGRLMQGTVSNCSVEGGSVSVIDNMPILGGIGGLVGEIWYGTISNCDANCKVSGNYNLGGLVGNNLRGTIENCSATGIVIGKAGVGALVGRSWWWDAVISNCYATGDVLGISYVGGLVGEIYVGTISNCYATGTVSGDNSTGGLVGNNVWGWSINNCYATGDVDGNKFTGGLIGGNGGPITNCYATGVVDGNLYTGGLIGGNGDTILNCYATGNVSGNDGTGGLMGGNTYIIENCYATGSVDGNENTGGLAGWAFFSSMSDCYAKGAVDGNNCTGGLVGKNGDSSYQSWIFNCYAAGTVTSDEPNTGGLIGCNYNQENFYSICFWDSDVNPDVNGIGNTTDPNVIGETTENMQTESTFTSAGWDFVGETANGSDDIWKMCYDPDYPHLWWEQCPRPSLEMPMHFTPRMLNPKSKGKWVKAHFILPAGFSVGDVNTNNPARIVGPFTAESVYMDVFINEDGLVKIMAAFDRAVFCSNGSMLEDIVVIAQLTTGQYFYGTDTIRIKTNNLEYLAVLTSYWLEAGCGAPDWCAGADLNRDSVVDFIDFALFDGCCLEFIKN